MNDEEIAQLQNDDEWDVEAGERQRAPRGNRAIVSVGFKTADFTVVSEAAERRDQPLSQFIREAALGRARGQGAEGRDRAGRKAWSIPLVKVPEQVEAWLLDAMRSLGRSSSVR